MRFHTIEKLSEKQSLTKEGYLLCKDVAIARTGTMLYGAGEIPVTPGKDGLIRIERNADELFSQTTLDSFEGKSFTLDHPDDDVNPDNWSQLTKGTLFNVRRGKGIHDDLMMADLMITDRAAIKRVRDGLRELSTGYNAEYTEIEPGRGMQTNILGNHLAGVDKGRCGSRCSIGDNEMKNKTKFIDRLRTAFKARDEAAHEKVLDEAVKDDDEDETEEEKKKRLAKEAKESKTEDTLARVADSLKAIDSRLATLETRDAQRVKDAEKDDDETEEEKKKREAKEAKDKADAKTSDAASVAAELQDTIARAEILSPGLQFPTVDAAAGTAKTRDAMCALRTKALSAAFISGKNRDAITPFVGQSPDFGKLTCDQTTSAFIGASEIVKRENNRGSGSGNATFDGAKNAHTVANTISEMNRRNTEFWGKR
jgi:hypothetical protein